MEALVRWVPTNRMLGDGLTKDAGDPIDLLRACIRRASYQISPEETVLKMQAAEKQIRRQIQEQRLKDSKGSDGDPTPEGVSGDSQVANLSKSEGSLFGNNVARVDTQVYASFACEFVYARRSLFLDRSH